MRKEHWKFENGRPYRLAHQILCITGFNFEMESLVGYVDMLFYPLVTDLKQIYINCQQCLIHRVAINDEYEPRYTYKDPTLNICQNDPNNQNIEYYESCHVKMVSYVDADEGGGGEICIKLPSELETSIIEFKPFRVIIEFSLVRPNGGIKFVVPDLDGTLLDRGAHLFSFGLENSARLWFPCIDSYSEVCTWKLELTVNMYMVAISCGDLVDTVYTPDLRKKTYHYYLGTPTAAPNIAISVGPFEVWVDPNMHEVTNFCLPHLLPILKHTTSFLHEVFEFYEELLSTRYPYSCYKQVFVDMAYEDVTSYATMVICSTNLLHSKRIIDQTPVSQRLLAEAVAKQFFGCFISMHTWCDAWLTKGLASLLSSLYNMKVFGNNAYAYSVAKDMMEVCQHECDHGPVVLDPGTLMGGNWGTCKHPQTMSPAYLRIYEMKSRLVMRMMEKYVGRELMLQVMNKMLALATTASQQKYILNIWNNMVVSTNSFLKSISTVTGKDVQAFLNQWVFQGGSVQFVGNFTFNRKRNVVELELKQDLSASKNSLKYAGPITVSIQELDGTFNHQFMVEENKSKFEIACHSKSRRQKKKKIPLCTGEEVEMNLDDTDADSPVLWVRVDPDMLLLRIIKFEQADFMWHYMLRHEKCVVAQLNAITALEQYPTSKTRSVLTHTIENEKFFYQVREDAAYCLMKVANAMNNTSWIGPPAMLNIFKQMFGASSCPSIVRRNNFNNFQHYFLQKSIPLAMSQLRNIHNVCPSEVLQFILDLLKYNDNSKNKYSDCYYRASLIEALSNTVSPAVTPVSVTGSGPSTDLLTNDTRLILEDVTRSLNMEKLLSTYRFTVTVSCLRALRKLQKFGHLPADNCIFKSYAMEGNFIDVRLTAIETLVDYTAAEADSQLLDWLMDIIENDPDHYLRFKTICMMIKCPPFTTRDSPLHTTSFKDRVWSFMNSKFSYDCRLRCATIDLYKVLYNKLKHAETLKEKKKLTSLHQNSSFEIFKNNGNASTHIASSSSGNNHSNNNIWNNWSDKINIKRSSKSPLHFEKKFSLFASNISNNKAGDTDDKTNQNLFKIKAFHSDHSSDENQNQEHFNSTATYEDHHYHDPPIVQSANLHHVNSLWSSIYPSSPSQSNKRHLSGDSFHGNNFHGEGNDDDDDDDSTSIHVAKKISVASSSFSSVTSKIATSKKLRPEMNSTEDVNDVTRDRGLDLSEPSSASSSGGSSPRFKSHPSVFNKPRDFVLNRQESDQQSRNPFRSNLSDDEDENEDEFDKIKSVLKSENLLNEAGRKLSTMKKVEDKVMLNLTSSDSEADEKHNSSPY